MTAGQSLDILPIVTGTGYVDSVQIADGNWYSYELDVYVNGESSPSIAAVVGNLCGNPYASVMYATRIWTNLDGCTFLIPIPFSTSIEIKLKNPTGSSHQAYTQVTYVTGVALTAINSVQHHLHAVVVDQSNIAPNGAATLINATGLSAGQLVFLSWTYDSANGGSGGVNVATAPLEGNFKIFLDGASSPTLETTGAEDLFGMFGYFNGLTGGGSDNSYLLFKNYLNAWSAVRFWTADPINFTSGLKMTWNCGDTTEVNFTGDCRVISTVIYYTTN